MTQEQSPGTNPSTTEVFAGLLFAFLLHAAILAWPSNLFPSNSPKPSQELAAVMLEVLAAEEQQAPDPEPVPEPEPPEPEPTPPEPEPEPTPPEPEPEPEPTPPEPDPEPDPAPPIEESTAETPPLEEMAFESDQNVGGTTKSDGELSKALSLTWRDYNHIRSVARRLRFFVYTYRLVDGAPVQVSRIVLDPQGPVLLEIDDRQNLENYSSVVQVLPPRYFQSVLDQSKRAGEEVDGVFAYVLPATIREWNRHMEKAVPQARWVTGTLKDSGGKIRLHILSSRP